MGSISGGRTLGQAMAAGAAWMVLLRVADRSVGVISLTLLARLLVPGDFGLVTLAASFIALVEVFGQFGVDLALIRDQRAERRHYDTAWTLNIITATVIAVVLALAAYPAADFFGESRIEHVIWWLVVAQLIGAFENIGVVDFRKDLEFAREFRYRVSVRIVSTIVTLALAWLWRDYWALVAGVVAASAIRVGLSYFVHAFRPRFSLAGFEEIFRFSKWVYVMNVIHAINDRAAVFAIGRMSNASALAHYSVAYEISNLASSELAAPLRRAIFPGFAKMAADRAALRVAFLDTFSVMVLLGLPIPLIIALTAPLIVPIFLGAQWLAAVPLVQVLSLYGVIRALGSSSHVVYLALGKPRITALLSCLRACVLIPALILATAQAGAPGAAWAMVFTSLALWAVDFAILLRVLALRLLDLFAATWRASIATLAMFMVVLAYRASSLQPEDFASQATQLGASVLLGAAVYLGTVLTLWRWCGCPESAEKMAVSLIRRNQTARGA